MSGLPLSFTGTFCDCGSPAAIQIDKVAGGYALQGGTLHEIGNCQVMVRCERRHQPSLKPDRRSKSTNNRADVSLRDISFFSKLNAPETG